MLAGASLARGKFGVFMLTPVVNKEYHALPMYLGVMVSPQLALRVRVN